MSSTTAKRDDSDSEDDTDYVPPTGRQSSSDSEDEGQAKEQTVEVSPPTAQDLENQQRERDDLWTSFQASVASSSNPELKEAKEMKMVKIQKRYLFAGEYSTEIVEVPEDSPDAKNWRLYQDAGPSEQVKATPSGPPRPAVPSSLPNPPPKKPGPRKPKKTLAAISATSSQKAKKLTTLDKSLMDWKAHTEDSALQDELEANRKTGGYLEKIEFLKRVDERKEENLESLQSRKRRKL